MIWITFFLSSFFAPRRNPHQDAHLYEDVDSLSQLVVDTDCHAERHWVKYGVQNRHEDADALEYGVQLHLSQPERHGHADSQSIWHSDIVSHGIAV